MVLQYKIITKTEARFSRFYSIWPGKEKVYSQRKRKGRKEKVKKKGQAGKHTI